MPLYSCAEPNLIKFDFRATLERRLVHADGVLASNLIREAGGNNFRREYMRSEFKNSVQIGKLLLVFRCISNI